jgi:tol-pal system beta propeller repeat protein TolB
MDSSNSPFTTFNKILLGASGCGMIIFCILLGIFGFMWENPPSRPQSTQVSVPILATATIPGSPIVVTFTPVTLEEKPSATPVPISTPNPTSGFGNGASLSGKIVYTCYVKQIDQICLMNADGSGQTQITKLRSTTFYASLSPDGQTIYFSSRDSGNFEIYSIRINGKKMQQLTEGLGSLYAPELSPNGQLIVFTNESSRKHGIWVMDPSGDNLHRLTNQNDIDPTWSPDSAMISFASDREGARQLFVMNADGSDIRQVTKLENMGGRSTWSPDGKRLAFYGGPANDHNIYVINVDGTGLTQLTHGGDNLGPSWSPDGNWIAFTSFRDGNNEIYVMHPDGTGLMRLTKNLFSDWQPRWGK